MSFYNSLSGLRAAQTDLNVVSNNIANVGSIGFKKSRAEFGDIFSSSPTQTSKKTAGQGTKLIGIQQQFTQGTLETTEKTLDLAISGEGFFVVKGQPPRNDTTYTRAGNFSVDTNRHVIDSIGSRVQLLPVDANGDVTGTALTDMIDFDLPASSPNGSGAALVNVSIGKDGLVAATFADGSDAKLGRVALASFTAIEGLRPVGDSHWRSTGDSGAPAINAAANGPLGEIQSGSLEHANVEITEELVSLISAQRNFQANAKAIETASNMTQTIFQIHA
ncbi:MAG TPA: flagellar hook-basal body complex protein [Sphingomonas sp.]|jgi:flagellar hook protein FlgE|nr:flagellar hook-basal body complex protein [Sphingomonas sp.]